MTVLAPVALRPPRASDRDRVEAIVRGTPLFRPDEAPVALEVFDDAVAGSADYVSLVAVQAGEVVGWICWGPTPCTLGTWDLYWIAVDGAHQGTGVGSRLLAEMERQLAGRARLIVVETAGRPDYEPTRKFYERRGYDVAARITGFYAPDDDQVVYTKALTTARR
ncbi:MAG: GNAT family N-acetyltransferase [Gemmatimonadales bacterium]|jgi:GNAT superfamily N-acetyltransferase|nr:GNAT family N-acetyltransferase [Gemmatimonadales bacterium]